MQSSVLPAQVWHRSCQKSSSFAPYFRENCESEDSISGSAEIMFTNPLKVHCIPQFPDRLLAVLPSSDPQKWRRRKTGMCLSLLSSLADWTDVNARIFVIEAEMTE
jgi:hypothetical protein